MNFIFILKVLQFFLVLNLKKIHGKKHSIEITKDERTSILLNDFGFIQNGYLYVNVTSLSLDRIPYKENLGFTLDRSFGSKSKFISSDGFGAYCLIGQKYNNETSIVIFSIDIAARIVTINRYGNNLMITDEEPPDVEIRTKRSMVHSFYRPISKRNIINSTHDNITNSFKISKSYENLDEIMIIESDNVSFNFHFMVRILKESEIGLYTLAFHNCLSRLLNISLYMEEKNENSFLSIGDVPLPIMYFIFFSVYFFLACYWLFILWKSASASLVEDIPTNRTSVFKIHYLMLTLTYIKSISLLFHGINYHFIEAQGRQEEAFAILFYIVYLMRGVVMFVTIALIGAGWTFVRHVLSNKEKKIFIIVVPLQILTNVAQIILLETEEGRNSYDAWSKIFIIVDLMCCGAILFPIVWSIRHLTQAATANGKAAASLEKLKSFRRFYILVVCYIYFTRVIMLLLEYTVPFRHEWLREFGVEFATLILFVVTGYEFRPMGNNPYLRIPDSDDEDDGEAVTQSGALETVVRVNFKKTQNNKSNEEDEAPLIQADIITMSQKESSHEYD